ncbi:hypothetical protein PHMEG_00034632 [Phytophthora megakarya]|uniref:Uncharacterized protein n=1 Tax=Phytophthora megakarya TaxID=4795 RepID=A0A225US65_9STRA|nr:hypothetical protein PHMEG_00034632 [Phytophthora megakarya]
MALDSGSHRCLRSQREGRASDNDFRTFSARVDSGSRHTPDIRIEKVLRPSGSRCDKLCGRLQTSSTKTCPGCTKQGAIKPGLMTRARGYKNPPSVARRLDCLPAVSKNIRPWPGQDETQVNPGFTRRS